MIAPDLLVRRGASPPLDRWLSGRTLTRGGAPPRCATANLRRVVLGEAEAAYRAVTPGSERLHEDAREYQPGGVSATSNHFTPYPPSMARGHGSRLWDVDGNAHVDDLLVVRRGHPTGHGHPTVMHAVRRQLDEDGTPVFGTPHRREIEIARVLNRLVPCAERVRFTNSGLCGLRAKG